MVDTLVNKVWLCSKSLHRRIGSYFVGKRSPSHLKLCMLGFRGPGLAEQRAVCQREMSLAQNVIFHWVCFRGLYEPKYTATIQVG